jgi:hypothetical protein
MILNSNGYGMRFVAPEREEEGSINTHTHTHTYRSIQTHTHTHTQWYRREKRRGRW